MSGTKLEANYNAYQYLIVFLLAVILDIIVHFFSCRKYAALKAGSDTIGFLPQLKLYYDVLAKRGPLEYTQGVDTMYNSINSWLLGALIAGITCTLIVILADLILQIIDYRNGTSD